MSDPPRSNETARSTASSAGSPRPFVGLHMRCCNVYVRAYANAPGDAFVGRCPRCGVPIRVGIVEEGGTSGTFFSAG